jgi:hypothetical protein
MANTVAQTTRTITKASDLTAFETYTTASADYVQANITALNTSMTEVVALLKAQAGSYVNTDV